MTQAETHNVFLEHVSAAPQTEDVTHLAARLKSEGRKTKSDDRAHFAAILAHAAFLAPDRIAEIYDAAAKGWLGKAVSAPPILSHDASPLSAPDGLWDAYNSVVEDAVAGTLDALSITQRTADLGGLLGEDYAARMCEASHAYPGVTDAAAGGLPPRLTLEQLAACPPGSLGAAFHALIVENTFDLEVLDRDALGLSALPKPLDYLNTRILQAHDLWHIVAGYETTALHEIALSGFQMAQFGHAYSAQFLSVTASVSARSSAYGFPVLMDTVLSAWAHGRETPPLMAIAWEDVWEMSAEDIRARFGITAYDSPYKPNLIESSQPLISLIGKITGAFKTLTRPFARA